MAGDSDCKVDEVIRRYDLDTADPRYESLNEGLLTRWTGADGRESMGYRTLTEWFNKRLLRRAFDEHGRDTLGHRLDHAYDALTGDDDLARADIIEDLDADGIDGRAVSADLVSWGTMRTHLQECLDGTKAKQSSSGDWERETVAMARSFATEKAESALSSLSSKGRLDGAGESTVTVQVQLQCDHCPTRVPFDVALDRGYVCEAHSTAEAHT